MEKELSIAIACKNDLLRTGLAVCIDSVPGLNVNATFSDPGECQKYEAVTPVDIVLADITHLDEVSWAKIPPLEVAKLICVLDDRSREVKKSGICDAAIDWQQGTEPVLETISDLTGFDVTAGMEEGAVGADSVIDVGNPLALQLTNREKEVIIFICRQLTTKEIAVKLNVATRTVEAHRERILQKLGCRNMVGVTLYAVKHGIVKI